MNIFTTGITGLDPDRTTTCEKKRLSWNSGLRGLNNPACKLTTEHKAKLKGRAAWNKGINHLGEDAIERIRIARKQSKGITGVYTRTESTKEKHSLNSSIPVMTPDGMFPSKGHAAEFYGIHRNNLSLRMKKHPDQYYALKERNSKGNSIKGPDRKGGRK